MFFLRSISRRTVLIVFVLANNLLLAGLIFAQLQFLNRSLSWKSVLGLHALFAQYLLEMVLPLMLGLLLLSKSWPWRFLAYAVLLTQYVVLFVQAASYVLVHEFISRMALMNANHIAWAFTPSLLAVIAAAAFWYGAFVWLCERASPSPSRHLRSSFAAIILTFLAYGALGHLLPTGVVRERARFLTSNNLSESPPCLALLRVVGDIVHDRYARTVKRTGLAPTAADCEVGRQYGIFLDSQSPFPLVHETIYRGGMPFPLRPNATKTPNIVVMFAEGISARLIGAYGGPYSNLTPNLDAFIKHPMTLQVTDYYNHTAATYRGIHGQLCSFFPTADGLDSTWEENLAEGRVHYFGLIDVVSRLGYSTSFVYATPRDGSFLDEMMGQLGVQQTLCTEELTTRFLAGGCAVGSQPLSDHQFFRAMFEFLLEQEKATAASGRPFFVGSLNVETHAFQAIGGDGIVYHHGNTSPLNRLHNFDHAFGQFWKAFQKSRLAENTILVLTSDHCAFAEPSYIKLVAPHDPKYTPVFFDRIPLVIYDPTHRLPKTYDAGNSTSLDLTPSLIHLLGFPNQANPFMGTSIFDAAAKEKRGVGFGFIWRTLYVFTNEGVAALDEANPDHAAMRSVQAIVKFSRFLECENRLWPATTPNAPVPEPGTNQTKDKIARESPTKASGGATSPDRKPIATKEPSL